MYPWFPEQMMPKAMDLAVDFVELGHAIELRKEELAGTTAKRRKPKTLTAR